MGVPSLTLTKDGLEMQIGTNHFGHFYLTQLLFDLLRASGEGRIINVSSKASERSMESDPRPVEINFSDINNFKGYTPFRNYSISKLCNVMFSK
jgi:NAD(P)-dependent dehydrogenase (short-subunit alcohol dehydrogenase family)